MGDHEGHWESVKTPFIQQPDIGPPKGPERFAPLVSDDNNDRIPPETENPVGEGTFSKSGCISHSETLAARLIQSSLDILQGWRFRDRSRHLGRFRLWADEYDTPQGQLDEILERSQILKETTITLLADLYNILNTQTSRGAPRKEFPSVLRDACTIYPGINQLFPDSDSDSGSEEGEIETIVDSLFNLSPLLVDILENLPGDTPTSVDCDNEAAPVSEVVREFDASAYTRLLCISLFILLVYCLFIR
ncbi:hypothetical protein HOY82DRAFT_534872 [Tuber indicum]|nr:hypothetical protein HOY82DRAFT_534872 [Tuber indicum]